MLYEKYEQKIYKFANILKIIKRFRILIIMGMVAIFTLIASLLAVTGNISDISFPDNKEFKYGEAYVNEFNANATLAKVKYEYRVQGSNGEWTETQPTFAGTYEVRAFSKGAFGVKKTGDSHVFSIVARPIEIQVSSSSVVYGEAPNLKTVSALGLVGNDVFAASGESFIYGDRSASATTIVPILEGANKIKIIRQSDGQDVSGMYIITAKQSSISFEKRTIEIKTGDATKEYDGTPLTNVKSEIISGSTAFDDVVGNVVVTGSITEFGNAQNVALTPSVTSETFGDVSNNYNVVINPGILMIQKRKITYKTLGKEFTYNAQSQMFDDETAFEITSGVLVSGHKLVKINSSNIVNVGSAPNEITFKVVDADDNDKTDNYELICQEKGALTVKPEQLNVVFSQNLPSKVYDGLPYEDTSYDVEEANKSLLFGHHLVLSQQEKPIDAVNNFENVVNVEVKDSLGNDVTGNYKINSTFGTITITPRPITIKAKDLGGYIYDGNAVSDRDFEIVSGNAVNGQRISVGYVDVSCIDVGTYEYSIDNNSVQIGSNVANYDVSLEKGTITIDKRNISFKPQDVTFVYDGLSHKASEIEVVSILDLPSNHEVQATFDGSQVDVTGVNYGISSINSLTIKNASGVDVTDKNFVVSKVTGTIEITSRPITIQLGSETFVYDGEEHFVDEFEVVNQTSQSGLASGQSITVLDVPTFVDVNYMFGTVNSYENVFDVDVKSANGTSTKSNYNVTILSGEVKITQRNIQIVTASNVKVYDATPLFSEEFTVHEISPLSFALVDGHTAKSNGDYTSIIETRENNADNMFTVSIFDGAIDKTNNYNLSYTYGKLNVQKRSIVVSTGSDSKTYDGTILTCDVFSVMAGEDIVGEAIVGNQTASANDDLTAIKNVNESDADNVFTISIHDAFYSDKTANYSIEYEYGKLSISRRAITLKPLDDHVVFDGQSHLPTETVVANSSENDLVDGHTVTSQITSTESVINVGSFDTDVVLNTVSIFDGYENVTSNYSISVESGLVVIVAREISIRPRNATKVYDGTELVASQFEYYNSPFELPNGFEFELTFNGSITNVGSAVSSIESWKVVKSGIEIDSNNFALTTSNATLEITHRPIIIQLGSGDFVYDGEEHFVDSFEVQNQTIESGLANEQSIVVSNVQSFINVKRDSYNRVIGYTNSFNVEIVDENFENTKDNYNVSVLVGEVKILPRDLKITTQTVEKTYDGTPLFNTELTVYPANGLIGNHQARADGEIPSLVYYSINAKDNFFDVKIFEGQSNVDVSTNYEIEMVYGTLFINKRDLYVSTTDESFVYDGNAHFGNSYSDLQQYLVEGDNESIKTRTEITFVSEGEKENAITFSFKNSEGQDITSSYNVIPEFGTLKITPRPIAVKSNDLSKTYDGTSLMAKPTDLTDVSLTELSEIYDDFGLPFGHVLSAEFVGSRVNVEQLETTDSNFVQIVDGSVVVMMGNQNVSDNFEVVNYQNGTLTVYPANVSIKPEDVEVDYDGAMHKPEKVVLTNDSISGFFGTDFAVATFVGSSQDITDGIVSYISSLVIMNAEGLDVTSNYNVNLNNGTIVIYRRRITLETSSSSWQYDGLEHYCDELPTVALDSLNQVISGHQIVAVNFNTVCEVNDTMENNNTCDVDIVDEFNNSVKNNYDVSINFGMLEITKRPLRLTTVNGFVVYDGAEHTFESFELNESDEYANVIIGHEIISSAWTSLTNVKKNYDGSYYETSNGVEIVVRDLLTLTDKTSNYEVIITYGNIHVESRIATITTQDGSFIYDGTSHTFGGYSAEFETELSEGIIETVSVSNLIDFVDVSQTSANNNVFTVSMIDGNGANVSDNYEINYVFGTVTIAPRNVTLKAQDTTVYYNGEMNYCGALDETAGEENSGLVQGHVVVATTCDQGSIVPTESPIACRVQEFGIFDSENNSVVDNYNVTISESFGYLTVLARPITLTPVSTTISPLLKQIYDGEVHTPTFEYIVTGGEFGLVQGDKVVPISFNSYLADVLTEAINVGTYSSEVNEFIITNSNGDDVTNCYLVTRLKSTLVIDKKPITVTTDNVVFTYDGAKHSSTLPVVEVIEGHFYEISDAVAYSEVADNNKDNEISIAIYSDESLLNDVTSNYEITYNFGKFVISPKQINVKAIGNTWIYDGEEHFEAYEVPLDCGLISELGHHFENLEFTKVQNVSKISVLNEIISFEIYDGENALVDSLNYKFVYSVDEEFSGLLTIEPRKITIETATSSLVYNGSNQQDSNFTLSAESSTADNQVVKLLKNSTYLVDVGECSNELKVKVVDVNDETIEYTSNYEISYVYGTLEIICRPITIALNDRECVYNGTMQYCDVAIDVTNVEEGVEAGLLPNHTIKVISIIGGGTYFSETPYDCSLQSYKIFKGSKDVTNNYSVSISDDFAKLTINKLEISIKPEVQEKVYNGNVQLPDNFVYLTGSKKLANGDRISLTYATDNEAVNVGSYTASIVAFQIFNSENVDVSSSYSVNCETTSKFTVEKCELNVYLENFTSVYNGFVQTADNATYDETQLIEGHKIQFSDYVSATNVVKVINSVNVEIFDDLDREVTSNYNVVENFGVFEITPKQIEVLAEGNTWEYNDEEFSKPYEIDLDSGLLVELGHHFDEVVWKVVRNVSDSGIKNTLQSFEILDESNNVITDNYFISYVYDEEFDGVLTVLPRALTITTQSAEFVYNGENQFANSFEPQNLTDGNLVDGHSIEVWKSTSAKNVGTYENEWTIKIFKNASEKTANYSFSFILGTVEITPRRIVITAIDQEKVYNGEMQYCDGGQDITEVLEGEIAGLVNGHEIVVTECEGGGIVPGEYPCSISGFNIFDDLEDVTSNYFVTTTGYSGTLTIVKREITIKPIFVSLTYNGSNQVPDDVFVDNKQYSLVEGDVIIASIISNGGKDVGNWTSSIESFSINNSEGQDVTDCYDVTTEENIFTILAKDLTISTNSINVVYDGNSHADDTKNVEGLIEGHTIVFGAFTSITNVSESGLINSTSFVINDENSNDITSNYNVTTNWGTLTITAKDVVVYVYGASWEYDGQYHSTSVNSNSYYSLNSNQLVNGQILVIDEWFKVKDHQINEEDNVLNGFDCSFTENGMPVERTNYNVIFDGSKDNVYFGKLSISQLVVNVTTFDGSWTYDGNDHFEKNFEFSTSSAENTLPSGEFLVVGNSQNDFTTVNGVTASTLNKLTVYVVDSANSTLNQNNYQFVYDYGALVVLPRQITVKAVDCQVYYNGLPQTNVDGEVEQATGENDGLVNGHSVAIQIVYNALRVNVGIYDCEVLQVTVYDAWMNDVTENYNVDTTSSVGKMEIIARPLVVVAKDLSKVYDATEINYSGHEREFNSITTSVLDNVSALIGGHYALVVSFSGSQTNVGTSANVINQIEIFDANDNNVSENYSFSFVDGTLEILAREIVISTNGGEKVYDGTPFEVNEYTIVDGELLNNDKIVCDSWTQQTDATNSSGVKNNVNAIITDENGVENTNYSVRIKSFGRLIVSRRTVYVDMPSSAESAFVYDGMPHSIDVHVVRPIDLVNNTGLVDGHSLVVSKTTASTVVGTVENKILRWSFIDSNGDAVLSNNYILVQNDGLTESECALTIVPRPIVVSSEDYSLEYSGKLPSMPNGVDATTLDFGENSGLVDGDSIIITSIIGVGGELTANVGTYGFVVNECVIVSANKKDVTANYSIIFDSSSQAKTLTIVKREISVKPKTLDVEYDAQYHSPSGVVLTAGELCVGQTINDFTFTNDSSVKNIGEYLTKLNSIVIVDESENNVTDNYNVTFVDGIAKITKRTLIITLAGAEKVYDGTPLMMEIGYTVNGMLDGDVLTEIGGFASQLEFGSKKNSATEFEICNAESEIVTDNYEVSISPSSGYLNVLKRPIYVEITSGNTWEYDGHSHSQSSEFNFVSLDDSGLLEGHSIAEDSIVWATISAVGEKTNSFTCEIEDELGNAQTNNYNLIFTEDSAKIKIIPTIIKIKAKDTSVEFDGETHSIVEGEIIEENGKTMQNLGIDRISLSCDESYVEPSLSPYVCNISSIESIIVYNSANAVINDNFTIEIDESYSSGYLTITKRSITIAPEEINVIYDGEPHSPSFVQVLSGSLVTGHEFTDVTFSTSSAKITPCENEISLITNFVIRDANGQNVTDKYYIVTVESSTVTINKREITIITESGSWIYDGQEHFANDFSIGNDGLLDAHKIVHSGWTSVVVPSATLNSATFVIVDKITEQPVDDFYNVSFEFGTLEVSKRVLNVTTTGYTWDYDGQEHYYAGDFQIESGVDTGLVGDDEIDFGSIVWTSKITDYSSSGINNVFTCEIVNGANNVTDCYQIVFANNESTRLFIRKLTIEMTSFGGEWTYDGLYHTNDEIYYDLSMLPNNHSVTVVKSTSVMNVSFDSNDDVIGVDNTLTIRIDRETNETIKNATNNFIINWTKGSLVINRRQITIKPSDVEVVYDGNNQLSTTAEVTPNSLNSLVYPHTISVMTTGGRTIPGVGSCYIVDGSAVIKNGNVDVTKNYLVNYSTQSGKVIVTKRQITIKPVDVLTAYDGNSHSPSDWTYAENSLEILTIHSLTANFDGVATDYTSIPVQSSIINYQIVDGNNALVSIYYDVTLEKGTIEIIKRYLEITTENESFIFDGEEHFGSQSSITSGSLVAGQELNVVFTNEGIVNVSQSRKNTLQSVSVLANDDDVSENYEIVVVEGELTIQKRPIIINVEGKSFDYDGQEHSFECNYSINSSQNSGIVSSIGDTLNALTWYSVKNVVDNRMNGFTFEIVNNETDVSENYEVSFVGVGVNDGYLIVNPIDLRIRTITNVNMVFNGNPQSDSATSIDFVGGIFTASNVLPNEQTISAVGTLTTVTFVTEGEKSNVFQCAIFEDLEDVSANYNISYIYGKIAVVSRHIVIKPKDTTKQYNGLAQSITEGESMNDGETTGLIVGHRITVECLQTATYPNEEVVSSVDKAYIYFGNTDLTLNYEIETDSETGILSIVKRELKVVAESVTKAYDGIELSSSNYSVTNTANDGFDSFIGNDSLTATVEGSITKVGSVPNVVISYVFIGNEEYYNVELVDGTLTVTPRVINLITASASKVYDGTLIANEVCEVTAESLSLLDGHSIEAIFKYKQNPAIDDAKQIDVGNVNNSLESLIIWNGAEDVTDQYDVNVKLGRLTITRRNVYLRTSSQSWIYDGETHFADDTSFSEIEVLNAGLLPGHVLDVTLWSSVKTFSNSGVKNRPIRWTVTDGNGNNVSSNYSIPTSGENVELGVLKITKRTINVAIVDCAVEYNGELQTCKEVVVEELIGSGEDYGLVDGDTIVVTWNGGGVEQGKYECAIRLLVIKNSTNATVTNSYIINVVDDLGYVTIQ